MSFNSFLKKINQPTLPNLEREPDEESRLERIEARLGIERKPEVEDENE